MLLAVVGDGAVCWETVDVGTTCALIEPVGRVRKDTAVVADRISTRINRNSERIFHPFLLGGEGGVKSFSPILPRFGVPVCPFPSWAKW